MEGGRERAAEKDMDRNSKKERKIYRNSKTERKKEEGEQQRKTDIQKEG